MITLCLESYVHYFNILGFIGAYPVMILCKQDWLVPLYDKMPTAS